MSSDNDIVLSVRNVSKCFEMYEKPVHRLYQTLCAGKRKFYKEFWALKDISFDLHRGECIGIIGRNGAGKSTLLQIITGTLAPTSGSVSVKGRIAALLELGSGFNPEFTGRENVYLNASILGLTKEEIDARYDDILAFADIGEFINQPVKSYSSGMAVRLAFAVIAHVDADVLIVDEALSVGDAFFQQKCMKFINDFKANHTILFVSHDTGAVVNLCTSAILLEGGAVKYCGVPKDVAKAYLKSLFSVDSKSESSDRTNADLTDSEHSNEVETADSREERDVRDHIMRQMGLQNQIEVFDFCRKESNVLGNGGARFVKAELRDDKGQRIDCLWGNDIVELKIWILAEKDIFAPIVGFHIKDRLGQELLGDNTYLSYKDSPLSVKTGQTIEVTFRFQMPMLKRGGYVFDFAIAEGTQVVHKQLEWVENAMMIESVSSHVSSIVGLNMKKIEMCASYAKQ